MVKRKIEFCCLITLIAILALVPALSFSVPPAKKTTAPTPPEMWGVLLPMGAKKMQIYRAAVSYRVNTDPEETAKQLLAPLGSSGIKVYRSSVGSTIMVFIESETPRTWSEIQISGIKGKAQSFIVIAKAHGDVGWRWKRNGKNWDFQ